MLRIYIYIYLYLDAKIYIWGDIYEIVRLFRIQYCSLADVNVTSQMEMSGCCQICKMLQKRYS